MVAVRGDEPVPARTRRAVAAGVAVSVVVAVAGLIWAKWEPYLGKAFAAARTHEWSGKDVLAVGGVQAGDAPSWHAATAFFHAYIGAIWPALVVALLLSACVQAFLPRLWLPRVMNRRSLISSAVVGGVAGTPSMMCACCSAPVAVTLRRSGVNHAAAAAYWLGNPLLNPAVLMFLALVAPWQWTVTRLVVGIATVVGGSAFVAVFARRDAPRAPLDGAPSAEGADGSPAAIRFARALLRLCVVLVPEYLVLVLVIGGARGWLLALVDLGHRGLLLVVLAAVVGTLLVIPTAGEIPMLQGLALLGVSTGVLGALLITLPAVSLPGIVMVARSFGRRATCATAAVVVAAGLLGAAVLNVL
jgi:uncharacterized membrane protein YraQ (UPF0718 family)